MKRRCVQIAAIWLAGNALLATQLIAGEKLDAGIGAVTNAPEYKPAHWGILVVDVKDGKTVFEMNPDKLFAPASVTKLFSTAAALDTLGADHRFETSVYQRGELKDGALTGDLILVAGGDLTLGGRTNDAGQIAFTNSDHTYASGNSRTELTSPDPLAGLNDIARQVAAAGIKHIRGDVLIDDRLFDRASGSGSGPRQVTPIIVNDNLLDVEIKPTEAGQRAEVALRPRTAAWRIDVRVETVAADDKPETSVRWTGPYALLATGKIPARHKPIVHVYEIPQATGFARSLLIEALDRAGVRTDASPLSDHPEASRLPAREAYEKLYRVAKFTSPPFSENAKLILKVSHNLHASTLPLLVAAKHGKRTLADGLKLQGEFLAKAGIEVDTISFGGGAGGAQSDFVTPRATVQLLRHMRTRPDFEVYKTALPILGVDGTLAGVVPADSPAKGKVFAKTGTLYWDNVMNGKVLLTSKALAGYMTTAKGRDLAFAVFVNNAHLAKTDDTTIPGKALGKVAEAIYLEE